MLSVIYAEYRYAVRRYAECLHAECRHANCRGSIASIQGFVTKAKFDL
jgi:hypothetical protein